LFDYKSQLVTKAWAFLGADTRVTDIVLPRYRRNELSPADWLRKVWDNKQLAPSPRLDIELRNSSPGGPTPVTFGMNKPAPFDPLTDPDFSIPINQTLAVVITFQMKDITRQIQLESIIEAIFCKNWPQFGVNFVKGYSQVPQVQRTNLTQKGVPVKKRVTFLYDFRIIVMRSQLV
jgi:hypothetical protein